MIDNILSACIKWLNDEAQSPWRMVSLVVGMILTAGFCN